MNKAYYAINPTGPWTSPLNWDLETSLDGELRIRFPNYVGSEAAPSVSPGFPEFPKLPIEIQYRIVSFCDIPTLFRLMQVSSAIRREAKRYFWSDSDAWFRIERMLPFSAGLAGSTLDDVSFLSHVRHLEIVLRDFGDVAYLTDNADIVRFDGRQRDVYERTGSFWDTLHNMCPELARIVLVEDRRRIHGYVPGDHDLINLEILARKCPKQIELCASFVHRMATVPRKRIHHPVYRTLWKWKGDNAPLGRKWEQVDPSWTRKSIMPPHKPFRGPVGMCLRKIYDYSCYELKRNSGRFLLLEAIERHHFQDRNEPFHCPEPHCWVQFTLPGQWTLHALNTRHDRSAVPPDTLRGAFARHKRLTYHILKKVYSCQSEMAANWGHQGSRERLEAETAFLHQLDHDSLYKSGTPAKDSMLWEYHRCEMGMERRDPEYSPNELITVSTPYPTLHPGSIEEPFPNWPDS